jgi:hypothetical protein
VNGTSPVTEVIGLTQGVYVFEFTVTDNDGATSNSSVQVTVNPEEINNQNPTANAGEDITITEPLNRVSLNGKGIASKGEITKVRWTQISGPSTSNIVTAQKYTTIVNRLLPGTYEFELTVEDNFGGIGKDTVKVIVALGRLSQIESNGFKVYPNPIRDIATFEITSVKPDAVLSLLISDVNGRVVMKKSMPASGFNFKERINLSKLIKGIYTVSITFNKADQITYKIIKM